MHKVVLILFLAYVSTRTVIAANYLEECSKGSDCAFPYVCRRAVADDESRKCRRGSQNAQYCERNNDCAAQGSRCIENLCVKPTGEEGSVCIGETYCNNGLACVSGICTSKSSTGAPCIKPSHCASTSDTCRAGICTKAAGVAFDLCRRDRDCMEPYVCMRNSGVDESPKCRPPANTGEFCETGFHCKVKEDGCENGVCTTGAPRKGGGRGSRSRTIIIVVVVVVVIIAIAVGIALFFRIKRSPRAALNNAQTHTLGE